MVLGIAGGWLPGLCPWVRRGRGVRGIGRLELVRGALVWDPWAMRERRAPTSLAPVAGGAAILLHQKRDLDGRRRQLRHMATTPTIYPYSPSRIGASSSQAAQQLAKRLADSGVSIKGVDMLPWTYGRNIFETSRRAVPASWRRVRSDVDRAPAVFDTESGRQDSRVRPASRHPNCADLCR